MKKIALISLLLVINSCHSQDKEKKNDNNEGKSSNIKIELPINPKTMQTHTTEEFTEQDIQKYKKNKLMADMNILERTVQKYLKLMMN
ncbi:hypothetical protein [Chryseobacterium sp. NKUCC03_KSP]|uniref:hypothetical protein n=1 Tax=Chryseobacterium sp. NKUCC03_KSP TaxID=2842125 RepID=UPI001C5B0B01|nr:hypothetical protein [Chryseobacterium sp. NKUCC03_KSP]MBW3521434.1 hypothetical protein [Chryseobacterium sp. NKUCC03_KSP]